MPTYCTNRKQINTRVEHHICEGENKEKKVPLQICSRLQGRATKRYVREKTKTKTKTKNKKNVIR